MKSFLILTLISTSLIADDIFLECNEMEALTDAQDYTVVLDMANKTADVSITEPDYSGKINIVLQPKYILIDGYINNWLGNEHYVNFSIDRKTLQMGFAMDPDLKKGQCAKVDVESNIL